MEFIGYSWKSTHAEKMSSHDGGVVSARVSDWDNCEVSAISNRSIVHIYWIKDDSGQIVAHGIRSAAKALRVSEEDLQYLAKMVSAVRWEYSTLAPYLKRCGKDINNETLMKYSKYGRYYGILNNITK